jgi:hypothetical protein
MFIYECERYPIEFFCIFKDFLLVLSCRMVVIEVD